MSEAHDFDVSVSEEQVSPVRRGHRLGRYILCYELAAGGMATVYLGRATGVAGFEKLVALKIIHPHLAKEKDFVDMFLDEARIAARISHPNVCGVFDFGKEGDTYFLAMDYLVGETCNRFARAVAKRPDLHDQFDCPLLMAYVIQQACEGLHAAHEIKGDDGEALEVVHRDMTPHNLFIGYDGSVRVVDFGVASAVNKAHETTAGTLKGKFAYMSPEQIRQMSLDRRSDIWSLGVSLWELLTRRRLFRRDGEYETLKAVLEDPIEAPSKVRPELTPAFDAIVMKALARDRDQRYATARAMGRDLARAIGSAGGASSPDLADLMDALFAKEREERSELLELARTLDPEQQSTSKVMAAPIAMTETSGVSETSMPSRTVAHVEIESPKKRFPVWALGVVGAALLGAVGLGVALSMGGDPAEVASVDEPVTEETTPEPSVAPAPVEEPPEEPVAEETPVAEPPVEEEVPPAETPEPEEQTSETPQPPAGERPRGQRGGGSSGSSGRRAEPAPTGSGTVNIVTPPGWAEIFDGSRRVGRSPTEVRLSAGPHRIRLMPYGEGPAITRRIVVENGVTSRLVVRLEN